MFNLKRLDRSLEADMSSKIFDETRVPDTNVPELKTWCACEERDIKILYTRSPENAFQEMIQWTEEGKLWKFPINNEQGGDMININVLFVAYVL